MTKQRTIGVLTSGGDCAGLNAVIRAVVRSATLSYGWRVVGLREGTHGLLVDPPAITSFEDVEQMGSAMMRSGGTILGTTNKGDPFSFPMPDGSRKDRSQEIVDRYHSLGLSALVGVGGDGSLAILRRIAQKGGINMVGIPKTIDNDVTLTESAIGFDTAVAIATEALDRLQPTAASHDRVMVLEVMGRDAGHIALTAGIAGGADVILIPEIPYTIEKVCEQIRAIRQRGRNFALVVVSEAVKTANGEGLMKGYHGGQQRLGGIGEYVASAISQHMDVETRVTVLGHVQRGGQPSAQDRLIASAFGVHAVDLIAAGKYDRMVAWQNRRVVDVPLADIICRTQTVDPSGGLVRTARGLGISLGD
jgi:ATP-dependent phosphofructokinase / diphosphate-dependent phosphofructokinase